MLNKITNKFSLSFSDFTKNLFALTLGSSLAQAITFGVTILLARFFYSPADFGTYSLYTAILSYPFVISTMKYDVALVVADSDEHAQALFRLSLYAALLVSLLLLVVGICNFFGVFHFYENKIPSAFFLCLAFSLFLISFVQICWMWQVRFKDFKILSWIRITESTLIGIGSIVFYTWHAWGLLAANILASAVICVLLFRRVYHTGAFSQSYSLLELKNVAVQYLEFPRINIVQSFLEVFQVTGITAVGAYYFSDASIGYYALCSRVLLAPTSLIVKPMAHVFFSEASERHRQGASLHDLTMKILKKMILILVPFFLIIITTGPYLFSAFFGKNWTEAGVYAQILVVWVLIDVAKAPIATIASVLRKQRLMLFISIISSVVLLITLLIGGWWLKDMKQMLILITGTQAILSVISIYTLIKLTRSKTE